MERCGGPNGANWRPRGESHRSPNGAEVGRGLPTSSPSANPVGPWKVTVAEEGLFSGFKRLVVGKPIPSHLAHHERLSSVTGLAVLSSDALSSVAYATEEILRVLVLAGTAAFTLREPDRVRHRRRSSRSWCSPTARRSTRTRAAAARTSSRKDNLGETPALIAAGVAADRLHPDGRGQHRRRRRRDHVGVSRLARQPRRADARVRGCC